MKKYFLLFLILPFVSFGQSNVEQETAETISWLNSKLSTYSYRDHQVEHNFVLKYIGVQKDSDYGFKEQTLYLYCLKEVNWEGTELSDVVGIPIMDINSIRFEEYKSNYHIIFNSKLNEKNIVITDLTDYEELLSNYHIILSKSLDREGLKPRMIDAFNYLFKLHGNDLDKPEKF